MSRAPTPAMAELLNKVEDGQHIILHMVPTRIIRVIAIDSTFRTFRVEQLVEHVGNSPLAPKGMWKPISTHGSETPWESYGPATEAGWQAQRQLIAALKVRIEARKNAVMTAVGKPGMLPGLGGAAYNVTVK